MDHKKEVIASYQSGMSLSLYESLMKELFSLDEVMSLIGSLTLSVNTLISRDKKDLDVNTQNEIRIESILLSRFISLLPPASQKEVCTYIKNSYKLDIQIEEINDLGLKSSLHYKNEESASGLSSFGSHQPSVKPH